MSYENGAVMSFPSAVDMCRKFPEQDYEAVYSWLMSASEDVGALIVYSKEQLLLRLKDFMLLIQQDIKFYTEKGHFTDVMYQGNMLADAAQLYVEIENIDAEYFYIVNN